MPPPDRPATGTRALERWYSSSRWAGIATIALGAALVVAGLRRGLDEDAVTTVAGLCLACLSAWIGFVRPEVRAYPDHVLLKNLVTNTRIPWHLVEEVDVRQSLRVFTTDGEMHPAEAVRRRRSTSAAANWRRSHNLGAMGFDGYTDPDVLPDADARGPDQVAERLVVLRDEHRELSRRRDRVEVQRAWIEILLLVALVATFLTLLLH